jgi:hypothetical protein
MVVLALVIAPVIALAVAKSTVSPTRKSATPTVDQQFAKWMRNHPGYSCGVLKYQSQHSAIVTCTKETDAGSGVIVALVFLDSP